MEKVSIIITTLNRGILLRTAIKSSLLQTYPKTEIIIIDGSSDGETSNVLEYYKNDIIVIKDTKNSGISAARNLGLDVSTGEYVTFLDDDDCFHPKKIERQIKILKRKKNVDIVYCPVGVKVKNDLLYLPLMDKKNYWIRLTHLQNIIMTPLVKKECFLECGTFDESLPYHEDRDIWYRLHKKFSFAFHNNPDYIFYNHNISRLSSKVEKICQGKILLYEKHKNDFENKKNYYSDLHYELAYTYITFGYYKQFLYHVKKSMKYNSKLMPARLLKYAEDPLIKRKIEIDDECKVVFS
jgi:glycosyltransferase involved in cell wall biosynthesis